MHGYSDFLNCVPYTIFFHKLVHPITGIFSGVQTYNNMDLWISSVFLCAINGATSPRRICCHGFLFPLLFSLVYFPFYCPLLLEGININELHNVVCTPLLTLVRVATPCWAIISRAGNRPPQTISFTFLESRSVPLKKCIRSPVHMAECSFQNSSWCYHSSTADSMKSVLKGYKNHARCRRSTVSGFVTFHSPFFHWRGVFS